MPFPILVPLPLNYVHDSQLPEGRIVLPLAFDFSKNNVLDPTGTFYTSSQSVQTGAIQSTRVFSAIKGIALKYNTYNNQCLQIKCLETSAIWVVGNPAGVAPGNSFFVINARIQMQLPQNATLVFTNFSLASDPPTTNSAVLQLTNFELKPSTVIVANPFGGNI